MVIEDDPDLRDFYRTILGLNGYRVVAFQDGLDALRHIDGGEMPDLVILDLGLPRLGGGDVKRELQANAQTLGIPILVVTGMDPRNLDPADFRCVVRKPITGDGLLAAVERCLRLAEMRSAG